MFKTGALRETHSLAAPQCRQLTTDRDWSPKRQILWTASGADEGRGARGKGDGKSFGTYKEKKKMWPSEIRIESLYRAVANAGQEATLLAGTHGGGGGGSSTTTLSTLPEDVLRRIHENAVFHKNCHQITFQFMKQPLPSGGYGCMLESLKLKYCVYNEGESSNGKATYEEVNDISQHGPVIPTRQKATRTELGELLQPVFGLLNDVTTENFRTGWMSVSDGGTVNHLQGIYTTDRFDENQCNVIVDTTLHYIKSATRGHEVLRHSHLIGNIYVVQVIYSLKLTRLLPTTSILMKDLLSDGVSPDAQGG